MGKTFFEWVNVHVAFDQLENLVENETGKPDGSDFHLSVTYVFIKSVYPS